MPLHITRAAVLAAAATLLAAPPSPADTTYQIIASNYISKVNPSCTVEVWAVFDSDLFAFAGADFDLIASPDKGGFSDPQRLLDAPGTFDGDIGPDTDSVMGILPGQIKQLPQEPHMNFDDPVLIWRGTWSTTDFTKRDIDLHTVSHHFEVYIADTFQSVACMGPLVEGQGQVHVGACAADCDGTGTLDLFDMLCFTNKFNAQAPFGDCDNNGVYDLFDFLCYLNAFNAGC